MADCRPAHTWYFCGYQRQTGGARRRIGCQRRLRPTQMRAAQAFRAEGMRNAVAVDRSQADPRWWPDPFLTMSQGFVQCLKGLSQGCPRGCPRGGFFRGKSRNTRCTARSIITVHRTFVSGYEGPSIAELRSVASRVAREIQPQYRALCLIAYPQREHHVECRVTADRRWSQPGEPLGFGRCARLTDS